MSIFWYKDKWGLRHRTDLGEFVHNFTHPIYDFFRQLKRLIEYIPVIWKDRDWDYHYLLVMLKYKLSRHRKDMENDTWHTQAKRRAKEMRTCELLLDRLIKDEYHENIYKNHDKK